MPATSPQLIAAGTIRPSRFVKVSAAHNGQEADANDRPIGITAVDTNQPPLDDLVSTQNHATTGQQIRLHGPGEECLLELGGTVAAGDRLKSDADGKGVVIATTGTTIQYIGAIAQDAGVSGELVRVSVEIYSERPALS